jgi:hypothetical protein
MDPKGKCRAPEHGVPCDTPLFSNNKSGYCAWHFHLSKKTPGAPAGRRGRKPKTQPEAKTQAENRPRAERTPPQQTNGQAPPQIHSEALSGNGNSGDPRHSRRIPVEISEFAMDAIWVRLNAEEKAKLLFPRENAHA